MKILKKNRVKKEYGKMENLRFVCGAEGYYGADDITFILYALIIACQAAEQSKIKSGYQSFLVQQWKRLISRNDDFMKKMEVENSDIF